MKETGPFGIEVVHCDHCRVVGLAALPVCTVCDRDTCKACDVEDLRVGHDTICKECMGTLHEDRHKFEPAGRVYPEYLYCRICGASETAHQE
jgi:hypothetical protein